MVFHRLSILGVGLLGGSIGLALKSISSNCHITGYGHRKESLERAISSGAVDEVTSDPLRAVQGAELVILCTPVGLFESLLQQIAPSLAPGTIVTDVGSTKRTICRLAEQLLVKDVHFVGSHHFPGAERRGIEAGR